MLKTIGQWIFPHTCCLCGQFSETDRDLCSVCWHLLPWITDRCYQCGVQLESNKVSIRCESCVVSPPSFDRLCALFAYQPPLPKLISAFKFYQKLAYGKILGELLADAILGQWYINTPLPEAIIPVPLHKKRLIKRGFNQSLELLWPLLKQRKIPLILDECFRSKNTRAQAKLSQEERQDNVKKAFQLKRVLPFEHVAIVDDVVTTGSTVNALSRILKDSGIELVDVWCIGRA